MNNRTTSYQSRGPGSVNYSERPSWEVKTDGNYFNAKGIPCVGMPTGMVDEHATSEHIAIADMVTACQIMVAIVTGPAA